MEKLKNVKVLTTCAMMLALATALGFLKIPITTFLELHFEFLPIACTGILFGAAPAAIVGALSDILSYLVKPTGPFFPGFTLSALLSGLIYGIVLNRPDLKFRHVVIAHLIRTVLINFLLNTYWLTLLFHKAFSVIVGARLIKTACMFPVELAMLWIVLRVSGKKRG